MKFLWTLVKVIGGIWLFVIAMLMLMIIMTNMMLYSLS